MQLGNSLRTLLVWSECVEWKDCGHKGDQYEDSCNLWSTWIYISNLDEQQHIDGCFASQIRAIPSVNRHRRDGKQK